MDNTILVNYIALLLGIVIFIISLYNYSFATFIFVAILPLAYGLKNIEGWEAFPAYRTIIGLLFLVAFLKLRRHWGKLPRNKFIYSYLIFVLGVMVSASLSPEVWNSFTRSLTYLAPLMTFIIIFVAAIDNNNGLKYILKGLILGYAVITIYGMIEFAFQDNILANLDIIYQDSNWMEDIRSDSGRLTSFVVQPVYLGLYFVITCPAIYLYNMFNARNGIKIGLYILLFGSVFCLIYTGTRTALLFGIIFFSTYVPLSKSNTHKYRLLAYLAMAIIIAMLTFPKLIEYNIESYNISNFDDPSAPSRELGGRLGVTIEMWNIFKEHMLAGLGPGYTYRMQQDYGLFVVGGMENQYAALLADCGIIGFFPYLVFLIITISLVKKSICSPCMMLSEWGKIVFCVLISLVITSISYCYITMIVFHIVMIHLGVLFGMETINNQALSSEKVTGMNIAVRHDGPK